MKEIKEVEAIETKEFRGSIHGRPAIPRLV
jgi:hypothetical protein